MGTHESLLASILANPEDETPRLVYADWLEEHGDDRCKFIRLQCRLFKMTEEDAGYAKLFKEQMRWLKKNRANWLSHLSPLAKSGKFYRGFVEAVQLGVRQFIKNSEKLFELEPVRHIYVTAVSAKTCELFAQCGSLPRIRELTFSCRQMTDQAWQVFADSQLVNMRKLKLTGEQISPAAVTAICNGNIQTHLTELIFQGTCYDPDAATAMSRAPGLAGLKKLAVNWCQIGAVGAAQLAISHHLNGLQSLSLNNSQVPQSGLGAIAESSVFEELRELNFTENAQQPAMFSFRHAHLFPNIETLNLSRNHLGDPFVVSAFESGKWVNLTRLDLAKTNLSQRSALVIAKSNQMNQLISLNLSNNAIGDQSVTAIIDALQTTNLKALKLASCGLTEKTASAILETSSLDQLGVLGLSGNSIPGELQKELRQKYGTGVCTFSRPI